MIQAQFPRVIWKGEQLTPRALSKIDWRERSTLHAYFHERCHDYLRDNSRMPLEVARILWKHARVDAACWAEVYF